MYQLRVLVNDRPVPVYHDYRNGTDWIEARDGVRYVVEVRNDNYKRILAVVSVDGLNVVNGKHEDHTTASGYIIHSHGNIKIPGWKISQDNVREFYFTPQGNSYAHKLGANEQNTGVIAAAIFEEKEIYTYASSGTSSWPKLTKYSDPPVVYRSFENQNTFDDGHSVNNVMFSSSVRGMSVTNLSSSVSSGAELSRASADMVPIEKLATGSGAVADFRTHKVYFGERILQTVLSIYYDTREGLLRRGLILDNPRSSLPKPFPNGDYCPDI